MLKNKSTKQERSTYSNGIHPHSVIKKLKEIKFWSANNSGALARGTHSLAPVLTQAKGSVNSKVCSLLYYLALLFYLA